MRVLSWIAAASTILFLLTVLAALFALRNQKFHHYVLHAAQQKASEVLGSQVELQDFDLGWSGSGPALKLQGVVVHGAAPYASPPLLQAKSIYLQVMITSFLHRNWYLNDIRIEGPVVRIFADKHGQTNIPTPPAYHPARRKTNVFDLGIRHLALNRGQIYYNDQKAELSADVHDVSLQSGYDILQREYAGSISYRDGHVQLQTAPPLAHQLDLRFRATPATLTIEDAVLKTPRSYATFQARVDNYAFPAIHARYRAEIDGGELQSPLNMHSLPHGVIHVVGTLNYQDETGLPFLASTNASGTIRSDELTFKHEKLLVRASRIGAEYNLHRGDALVSNIRAQLLGGSLEGALAMHDLTRNPSSRLKARLNRISAAAIQELAGATAANRPVVKGALNAKADATWSKDFADLLANAAIEVNAEFVSSMRGATPVNAKIRGQYDARRELLRVHPSTVRTPQNTVTLAGAVSRRSALQVHLQSRDLREIEDLAAAFIGPDAGPFGLYGQADFAGTVSGPLRDPRINGQLKGSNLKLRETAWKSAQVRFTASSTGVRLDQGTLIPVKQGKITFQGSTLLRDWSFTETSPFEVRLNARNINASDIVKAAGIRTPVTGTVTTDIQAHGTQLAPIGQGKVLLARASVADVALHSANLTIQGSGSVVSAKLRADSPAGTVIGNLQYQPRQQSYQADLQATQIKLDQLAPARTRDLELAGLLHLNATGRGTLKDPGWQAAIEVPRLSIRNQVLQNLRLTANVGDRVATLDLAAEMAGTKTAGHGVIQLNGDYPADVKFDTQAIPLQPLIAMYAPAQAASVTGQTELHATLRGPLKQKDQIEAHAVIPQLWVKYKDTIQLAAAGPIRADFANGSLDVKRSAIAGTGTDLIFQAHIPAAANAPASMLLQGTVDLRLAQLFDPDITSGGQLKFDIDSYGRRSDPNLQGQIRIINASFAQAGAPLGLRDGNGVLTLTRNRLDIREFQGKVGGGTVTGRGGIVYRPNLQFDMAMKAEGVRLLYEQSVRVTFNSGLALTGHYDDALLRGQVDVDQLSFTSNFDLLDFAGQFGGGEATLPPTGGFAQQLRLEVAIETPGVLSMSSRDLSLAGSAALRLRGTAAQPVMLGRINLTDGDLIFYGNRYLIQSGTIDLRNPSRTEPVLDVAANTTINQYNIQMHFWGPADHLHTNYSSDPALPPSDIINLIAFGKTSEAAAANPTPPGRLGAQSLIASQVSSQVTSRIAKVAGISQLSIDPVLGSSQQSPGARIAIQQRVTSKIFVTFATDLTSTQQQAVKLEYQLNRRTSFNAVRNQNGGLSFETTFRKDW
jgi:translocation and assembly module TamB